MALSGDSRGHHSAPSSSGGDGVVDSANGTPYTSLASGSPEEVRAIKSAGVDLSGNMTASSPHDPFVSTGPHTNGRLSAKASSFQPSFEMTSPLAPAASKVVEPYPKMKAPKDLSDHANECGTNSFGCGNDEADPVYFGTFTTDSNTSRVIKVTGTDIVASFLPFVEASKRKLREHGFARRGSERPERLGNSYYIRLSNIRDATELCTAIKMDNPALTVEYVSPVLFGTIFSPGRYSVHEGQVLLTVNYPHNSNIDGKLLDSSLVRMLELQGKVYAWHKFAAKEDGSFYMLAEFEDSSCALGAVTNGRKITGYPTYPTLRAVTVSIDLFRPDLAEQIISQQIYSPVTPTRRPGDQAGLTSAFGNISLGDFAGHPAPSPSYMASPALPNFPMSNPLSFAVGGPGSVYLPPGVNSLPQGYVPGVRPSVNPGQGEPIFHPFGLPSGGFSDRSFESNAGFQQPISGSPASYYTPKYQEQTREVDRYNRSGSRRPYVPRVQHNRTRQHSSPANSHHNHVDIAKIRQGIDVRTTIMLRNIPNKVDQAMLKEIVDESSFGKYDFMYLRIDFSNNCNVGYAFINFTDPLDIIDFAIARSNQKWHMFKSDKIAEVSYATIQGKDCLVQKFRNSSVMLEPEHYRPKLFKTIHDQFCRAGEEEHFPESDNASKLKRSCENAEHVGLFAPSAGQHLRDEQRRRRSQYDRGTSLAEREENGFDNAAYDPFGFSPV